MTARDQIRRMAANAHELAAYLDEAAGGSAPRPDLVYSCWVCDDELRDIEDAHRHQQKHTVLAETFGIGVRPRGVPLQPRDAHRAPRRRGVHRCRGWHAPHQGAPGRLRHPVQALDSPTDTL